MRVFNITKVLNKDNNLVAPEFGKAVAPIANNIVAP